jgi:eukaryotic-like serine/threonine-protein kinase
VGTPVYMSPEQSAGDELVDGRTDQYSLVAVLYETLTLLPPFTGPNARAIFAQKPTEPPPVIRDRRADVSPALEQVLFRALERAREARYETIEEFSTALADAATRPHVHRMPAP